MSVFVGAGIPLEYPVYLVTLTTSDSNIHSFFLANLNGNGTYLESAGGGALNGSAETGLIAAIDSYLDSNGWGGVSITSVAVTKYTEASADATP